jgi:glutathione synthase
MTMKPRRLGIVMDPLDTIHVKKDTTLALMLEAQARGWELYYMTMDDLCLNNGKAEAWMRRAKVYNDLDHWFDLEEDNYGSLGELDVILMRKDPPFDLEYIMATYILEHAEREGALVINRPQSLRDANEKVFSAWVPECCPPALLTRSKSAIKQFLETHQKIVVKPTDRMGGQSIFVISEGDPNTNVIIEEMTRKGSRYVQVQAYLHQINETGDKRILLINGQPVETAISRIPGGGDHRGNLAVGAEARAITLSERDYWICAQLQPIFRERGLFFVGIDIIGDYLTEINVTSPTGIREINHLHHVKVEAIFFDALDQLLPQEKP